MLDKVKSIYISKKIFSIIDEKRKLEAIKYNKKLQNIMKISLLNYKFYSKKYIIIENNGFEKEYDYNDNLIYEGEHIKGKRNGKGKEFYNNKLIFEGEYLNGKRNGKGKKYDKYNNIIFEGEYLNGKKWNINGYNINHEIIYEIKEGKGFIKEYDEYGRFIFEGEYLNGERNGKGKEFDEKSNLI